jgi:hypothetical protein
MFIHFHFGHFYAVKKVEVKYLWRSFIDVHKISGKCQKHKKKVISIFLLNNDEDDDSYDEAIQKRISTFEAEWMAPWMYKQKRDFFFISMNSNG